LIAQPHGGGKHHDVGWGDEFTVDGWEVVDLSAVVARVASGASDLGIDEGRNGLGDHISTPAPVAHRRSARTRASQVRPK
jgi:hypothetical protein